MQLVALTSIMSGILILLGWFTLPVRVSILAIGVIVASCFLLSLFRAKRGISHESTAVPRDGIPRRNLGMTSAIVAIVAAAIATILLLWSSGTTESIRSPWSVVPTPLFFLYALIAAFGIRHSAFGISIALLLSSLVALLVFPLGFGFDHFIHAAAERIIAITGALSPPPLFYSGHYGLAILLADFLPWADVALADRLIVPLLTLLLVPLAYQAFQTILPKRGALLGTSALLIVPFLPIAVSTPQATANIFGLSTIFLIISTPPDGRGSWREWAPPITTSLAALLAQPMTGIITIAIVAIVFAWQHGRRIVSATIATLGAVGIPLAFAVAGRIVPNLDLDVAFDPLPAIQRLGNALGSALTISAVDFATADALEVARALIPLLWIALTMNGIRALWRRPTPTHSPSPWEGEKRNSFSSPFARGAEGEREGVGNRAFAFILTTIPLMALAAAAFVAATVTIPTQLGEEQSQFPLRLVQLAALLATPLAGIGLGALLERVCGTLPRVAVAGAFGAAATFTLLLAYPRDDAQTRSGLWSVSASDIAAVHAIADDAGDAPYVVLANQMLGAAAIREFGFRPSFTLCAHPPTPPLPEGGGETKNFSPSRWDGSPPARGGARGGGSGEREGVEQRCTEILAFPLPAGGPIARQFWKFVSQDPSQCFSPSRGEGELEGEGGGCLSRGPVDTAMDLVGAERAYVVLRDYWRNYERTAAAAAALADVELAPLPRLRIFRFN